MKKHFSILLFSFMLARVNAQENVDSLKNVLQTAEADSMKLHFAFRISSYYRWRSPDSTIKYASIGLELARKLGSTKQEILLYQHIGGAWSGKGNFSMGLEFQLMSLKLSEKLGDDSAICWSNASVGSVYFYSHDYEKALSYYLKTKRFKKAYDAYEEYYSGFIGETYFHLGEIDSALLYIQRSYELDLRKPKWTVPYYYMGKIFAKKGQYSRAIDFYRNGIGQSTLQLPTIEGCEGIAAVFRDMGKTDSAIYYAKRSFTMARDQSFADHVIESSALLRDVYKSIGHTDSAFKYQEIMIIAKDSVYSQEKVRQVQNLAFNEQFKQQQNAAEQAAYRNRIRMYGLIAIGGFFLIVVILLLRNNRHKQKAKTKIETAYTELKNTQAQLIQSEKMASLGELTAGIAHEIQNPLNFVNNFSEVNNELVDEMNNLLSNGDIEEAKTIAGNIKQNLEKINHHGKRADAIVKGMLQHSRSSSGQKEPTDINALADEYLRLAYHGLRAKDKSFNANFKTDFNNSIGKVNIIPQDIGRVILNLITNAFYVVNEKKNKQSGEYEPMVKVSTKQLGDRLLISVKDNGNGIPLNVLEKIFQPFFTTKPTGQGTGLGLSLSYDIVKAHGGELKVNTREGEGSEFIIQLPTT